MMQLLKVLGDYEALEKAVISAVGAALEETDRRGAARRTQGKADTGARVGMRLASSLQIDYDLINNTVVDFL